MPSGKGQKSAGLKAGRVLKDKFNKLKLATYGTFKEPKFITFTAKGDVEIWITTA